MRSKPTWLTFVELWDATIAERRRRGHPYPAERDEVLKIVCRKMLTRFPFAEQEAREERQRVQEIAREQLGRGLRATVTFRPV